MSRLFFISLLTLIITSINAQKTFKMVLSSNGYDVGVGAFRTTNDEYLIVGNTSTYGQGGNDIWVIALDSNANFIWQKTYGTAGNDEAVDAILTNNDELIIVGKVSVSNPATINNFILEIDVNGVPLLNHQFGGSDWDFAKAVTMLNDTVILVCGTTYNGPNPGYLNPFVSAISTSGIDLWTSYEGAGGEEDNMDIILANDSLILISGATLKPDESTDSAYIKALNTSGIMQWHSIMPFYDGAIMAITSYEDSLIAATGFHWDSTHQWREPLIAKINSKGKWIYVRDEAHGADSYFSEITVDSMGLIIIAGLSTKHTNGGDEIYIGAFDTWGWYQKANILGGKKDDYPASILYHHADSTYLTCGTTKSFNVPYSGIILNQAKNNGMQFDTTTVMMMVSGINDTKNNVLKIQVYPNPTQDIIYLKCDIKLKKNLNINIYNSNGQLVKSYTNLNSNNSKSIDISELSKGIYYLELINDTQKAVVEIIKQ